MNTCASMKGHDPAAPQAHITNSHEGQTAPIRSPAAAAAAPNSSTASLRLECLAAPLPPEPTSTSKVEPSLGEPSEAELPLVGVAGAGSLIGVPTSLLCAPADVSLLGVVLLLLMSVAFAEALVVLPLLMSVPFVASLVLLAELMPLTMSSTCEGKGWYIL